MSANEDESRQAAAEGSASSVSRSASASDPGGPAGKVLLSTERLGRTLTRIAHEVVEHNPDPGSLALVGIQRRGVELAERLAARLEELAGARPATGAIDITFYRDDLDTRAPAYDQPVVHSTALPFAVQDRTIVLVDDVLFTGRTIRAAIDVLFDYGRPAAVRLAVLIDRGHRELPIRPDYVGKNVPTSRAERVTVRLTELDGVDEVVLEKPQ
jgi:pyrimidine operon attenuation protein / uracil phosphoribosyltransferase